MNRWRLLPLLALAVACAAPARPAPAPAPASASAPAAAELARGHAVLPRASFEVVTEEVSFTAGGRAVRGTLARPQADGARPAVLLLAGSGPTDRDWNSPLLAARNGSGALLAAALARHGAVVLRFDKAGSGTNPGPPLAEWTLDTYRDEAAAALALLRSRPEVRGDRVFVAGHSEGGIHATRLAQVARPPLAGVLYLASASRTMRETTLTQIEAQLRNPVAGLTAEEADRELRTFREALAAFMAGAAVDPQQASTLPQLQRLVAQLVNPATAALVRPLLDFDTAAQAGALAGPFFVLAGGKDLQIDPELDGRRLERALRDAGRAVSFHVAADADHVLKHEPKTPAELRANLLAAQLAYNAPERALDAGATAAIVGWLAARSR